MKNEDCLYIENEKNEKFYYSFTPAGITSNFVPLVVILDSEDKTSKMSFEYKMWNVLKPKGKFSKELLQKLIEKTADDCECEEHIYIYATASDGFEGVQSAVLADANALFADISSLAFEKKDELEKLLNASGINTIFYLCESAGELVDVFEKNATIVRQDFCPKLKDDERVKVVLDMFEKMDS